MLTEGSLQLSRSNVLALADFCTRPTAMNCCSGLTTSDTSTSGDGLLLGWLPEASVRHRESRLPEGVCQGQTLTEERSFVCESRLLLRILPHSSAFFRIRRRSVRLLSHTLAHLACELRLRVRTTFTASDLHSERPSRANDLYVNEGE